MQQTGKYKHRQNKLFTFCWFFLILRCVSRPYFIPHTQQNPNEKRSIIDFVKDNGLKYVSLAAINKRREYMQHIQTIIKRV